MTAQPIPLKTRRAVAERSGGICECGCGRQAVHVHHRRLRSQGGTHDLTNLLHLAVVCHEWAHAHPGLGYETGLLVHSWADPAEVPVLPLGDGGAAA